MVKHDISTQESQVGAKERRAKGEFVRGVSGFRHAIGEGEFSPEPGRYHLFVALNCPWCHRAVLARNVLGLQNSISMDVAFPSRTDLDDAAGQNLWEFNPKRLSSLTGETLPECTFETATGQGFRLAREIYQVEGSSEQSVPILYDKKLKRIVNNESAEIIRMLDQNAEKLGARADRPHLWPDDEKLQTEIEALNEVIYVNINNGAYKAGFSSDQSIYARSFEAYFDTLTDLNSRLSDGRKFLTGDAFNDADLRLFPTLYRHDPVYYLRMKLNGAKILDYPHIWRWLCRVYALDGVAEASVLTHCRQGYFGRSWNNTIPIGPFAPMSYPEAYLHPELTRD